LKWSRSRNTSARKAAPRQVAFEDALAFRVHEAGQRTGQHRFDAVAEDRRHFRIDEGGVGVGVDFPDAFAGAVHDAPEALLAAFERGQLAVGMLDHHPAGLPAAVGAGQQGRLELVAFGRAPHPHQALLRRLAVQRAADESVKVGRAAGRRDEAAQAMGRRVGARDAEHFGADQVGLQNPAVEADHEIADRRQQVEFVEVGRLVVAALALEADAAAVHRRLGGIAVVVHVTSQAQEVGRRCFPSKTSIARQACRAAYRCARFKCRSARRCRLSNARLMHQ
jgi:hypothetical protein